MRESDTVSLSEFTDRLGLAYTTAARWCNSGKLRAEKFGGQWRVERAELERLTRERQLATETIVPFRAAIGELYRLRDHAAHRLQAELETAIAEYASEGDRLEPPGYHALRTAIAPLRSVLEQIDALAHYDTVIAAAHAQIRASAAATQ